MKTWSVRMLGCLAVVLVLAGPVVSPIQATEYGPVQQFVGTGGIVHWYQAVCEAGGISWTNAKNAAVAKGGYLATITSVEENNFAFGLIDDDKYWLTRTDHNLGPYLGGYQPNPGSNEPGGGWSWVTLENWEYTNWYLSQGQPDNSSNIEHSLHYLGWIPGNKESYWNDVADDFGIKGYIIEYDSNPVPLPPGVLLLGSGLLGLLSLGRFRKQ